MLGYNPVEAIEFVQIYGKYRTPSWRNETRARRQLISPTAFDFANRRMQGIHREADAEMIDVWFAEDPPPKSKYAHFQKIAVREGDSSIFRNVIWPPQDRPGRSIPIPVPSTSTNKFSQDHWYPDEDYRLFTHSILEKRKIAVAAGHVRAIRAAERKTDTECTESFRELFDLPLSREDRLRLDWTADEDRELLSWVDFLGERDWLRISHFVRHHQETCKFRYKQLKGEYFNSEIDDDNEAGRRRARQLPACTGSLVNPAGQDGANEGSQQADSQGSGASNNNSGFQRESPNPQNGRQLSPYQAPSRKHVLNEDYDNDGDGDDEGGRASSPSKKARHSH